MKIPFNGMGRKSMTKKILATQRSRMYRLFKESLKCCSCGYDRDSSALEFHHIIPSDKLEELPKLVSMGHYDVILAEFRKCAVVCSNCHNIIHNSTNANVALDVAKALVPVNTTYFKELCEAFNVLVDEEIEDDIEVSNSTENIEILVAATRQRNASTLEMLRQHLIDNYNGVATSDLHQSKIAQELSISDASVSRGIKKLQKQERLNGHVDSVVLMSS